jgi:U32 family peptidase
MKLKKPELMSPVSDLVSLKAAINSGCNAVYFGLKNLNMRATAKNFELSQLNKIVSLCHKNNVKAYLTLNTIIFDSEINDAEKIIKTAKKVKIDAIICWDHLIISLANKYSIPIIISTQASVSNLVSAQSYKQLGAKRIVIARECSLEDIKIIKEKIDVEIEVFIHGAMCVSVSGRCFLSQFLFNKSANRGECLQPCRRKFLIKDPEENHELELNESYVMSPKDLSTIMFIEKIIESGVDSLKIEGRARSPEYVRVVTSCYRKAIDAYFNNTLTEKLKKELEEELKTVHNRGFSDGFFFNKKIEDWTDSYGSKATTKKIYLGKVKKFYKNISVAEFKLETNDLKIGDKVMFQGPTTGVYEQNLNNIQLNHKDIKEAKKGSVIAIKTDIILRPNDKIFIIKKTKINNL